MDWGGPVVGEEVGIGLEVGWGEVVVILSANTTLGAERRLE